MRPSYTCRQCLSLLKAPARAQWQPPPALRLASRSISSRTCQPIRARSIARPLTVRRNISNTAKRSIITGREGVAEWVDEDGNRRQVILQQDDLFHPYSKSPIPEIRERAAGIKQTAYCSHPSHKPTRLPTNPDDPEARKSLETGTAPAYVDFECPDCGIPVYCCEEHWADDYERHLEVCDTLRQVNEDDHDLRSGRYFKEFIYPPPQEEEILPNFTSWDTLMYTRQYEAIDEERRMRQATKQLTYPMTIASVITELSPYNIRNRLTVEGLKSFTALRHSLHPPRTPGGDRWDRMKIVPPDIRIFVVGARAESSIPRECWHQLTYLFPRVRFHIIFIGPESMMNRDDEFPLPERTHSNPFGAVVEDRISPDLKISTYVEYFHTMHKTGHFAPYDTYFDCFMLFHPGLGNPATAHEWEQTLPLLLETRVPIISTGYTEYDMMRDVETVKKQMKGEVDILLEPGENIFRSLRWDLNDEDPHDLTCGNWGLWAFRGKRYETKRYEGKEDN